MESFLPRKSETPDPAPKNFKVDPKTKIFKVGPGTLEGNLRLGTPKMGHFIFLYFS